MAELQDYTRLKRKGRAATPVELGDMAWSLVLDSLVLAAEVEIRRLDHCQARLRPAALERGRTAAGLRRRLAWTEYLCGPSCSGGSRPDRFLEPAPVVGDPPASGAPA